MKGTTAVFFTDGNGNVTFYLIDANNTVTFPNTTRFHLLLAGKRTVLADLRG